ncbi:MAG: SDR family oxidoreductase [Treponema sp.]|nr:SDR family oxidoreductase [Treponema sp.]
MTVFSNRRALIIGGSGAIGSVIAHGLAQRGASVTVHGAHSLERLNSVIESIRRSGGHAQSLLCPLDSPDMIEKVLDTEHPDIFVCAWGPFRRGALETMTVNDWQYLVYANLMVPGMFISALLPSMIEKKWGRLLLFGGTNTDTIRAFKTTALYSSAKTALGTLAKSVALVHADICCNVLCPGLTDTFSSDCTYNHAHNPGGKILSPQMIATVALNILENPQINGAIIPVDYGLKL